MKLQMQEEMQRKTEKVMEKILGEKRLKNQYLKSRVVKRFSAKEDTQSLYIQHSKESSIII